MGSLMRWIVLLVFGSIGVIASAQDERWQKLAQCFSPPAPFANQFGNYRSPLKFEDGSEVKDAKDWPRRRTEEGELPIVPPAVRAAAADADGNLWISLSVPYTYVYDTGGDKIRTVQFRAAGVVSPRSLYFTRDRRVLVTPGCSAFHSRSEA